jgi:hypothetical protein
MVWRKFCVWWKKPRLAVLNHLHFVMYTKPGCSLCDKAWAYLLIQQQLYHFCLERISIEGKKELHEQFGCQIPVVSVNGKVRFRGIINPVLLRRFLQGEARKMRG